MYEGVITSGYLIEKTFRRMYREFIATRERYEPHLLNTGGYSTPRTDIPPEQMSKQYRGLQREPMQCWIEDLRGSGVVEPTDPELNASLYLDVLMTNGNADSDIILKLADAREVMRRIEPPVEREIIWARRMGAGDEPLPGTVLLGYEPGTFYPPVSTSAIAEGLFFTYPGSNDEEGSRFQTYHDRLNRFGLFDTPADAEQYLKAYLDFLPADWDQQKDKYYTIEIRAITD